MACLTLDEFKVEMAASPLELTRGGSQGGMGDTVTQDSTCPIGSGSRRSTPKSPHSGRSRTERLWKEYFTDPSQWWDNRTSKATPKSPDFKHRKTKESLWIDGWYNPGWVKEVLKEELSGTKEKHLAQTSSDQGRSNSEECGLLEYASNCKTRVQLDSSEAQELRENSNWEKLTLEESLTSLERMQQLPSVENCICVLQKCRKEKNLGYAQRLHACICRSGLEAHRCLGNYLIPMLVDCESVENALQVFDKLLDPNECTWTSLIAGYIECGDSHHALNLYKKMRKACVLPSRYTFVALLKGCARLKDSKSGQETHTEIARKGLERDRFLGNTLVDMYAKCGSLGRAHEVFDTLPVRDAVSWTALITGYAEHGFEAEALNCFEQMQLEGVSPDAVTIVCSLKTCGNMGAIEKGREIHAMISRKGLERHTSVGNTLVDMYAKFGALAKAREVFDKLPVRGVISWTAIISGYAQRGLGQEALDCFQKMQREGVSPDVVSWNALFAGYAQLGESKCVFQMFERMRGEGVRPNGITFLSVLTVCNHAGLVDKAQEYFEAMSQDYGITPTIEHHNCMIDLLCRVGQLDEAVAMIETMPFHPNLSVWHTVLGACRQWGNVELGRRAFQHAVQLDGKDDAAYVLMANIYADAQMQEDETMVEAMRTDIKEGRTGLT